MQNVWRRSNHYLIQRLKFDASLVWTGLKHTSSRSLRELHHWVTPNQSIKFDKWENFFCLLFTSCFTSRSSRPRGVVVRKATSDDIDDPTVGSGCRSFEWDRNRGPVSQQVWPAKEPSLLKTMRTKHRSKFTALSLVRPHLVFFS
jgi:hypothetical protein